MRPLAKFTIWVLLFALGAALGDGPFVDEMLAASHQQQARSAPDHEAPEAAAVGSITVYTTLMHAASGVSHRPPSAAPARHVQPPFGQVLYASVLLPPADKPPRSSA